MVLNARYGANRAGRRARSCRARAFSQSSGDDDDGDDDGNLMDGNGRCVRVREQVYAAVRPSFRSV